MRINFYGGPGTGKSTMSALVFAELKKRGISVEQVQDYVKQVAYDGKDITKFDQLYFFAKQLNKEHALLKSDVEVVVTDTPILLTVCYAMQKDFPEVESLEKIANAFDLEYPSINIFLSRGGKEYKRIGRFETEMEARIIDDIIYGLLKKNNVKFSVFKHYDFESIMDYIAEKLGM